MRKILPILVIGILLLSGIGTLAINIEKIENVQIETITEMFEIDISSLKIKDDNEYIEVNIGKDESYLMNPGQPMIPRLLKTYELPFGVTNIKIEANPSGVQEFKPGPVFPAKPGIKMITKAQVNTFFARSKESIQRKGAQQPGPDIKSGLYSRKP